MRKTIGIWLCLVMIVAVLTSCAAQPATPTPETEPVATADLPAPSQRVETDREGFPITLPEQIDAIISIGPSNTEVLVALGFGDLIIATDMFSEDIEGIHPGISVLDMMALDLEFIVNAQPDIVFVTGMSRLSGDQDPLRLVTDAGISVIYMPSSASIAAIMEDILFMADVMDAQPAGLAIIAEMETEIERVRQISQAITERRRVYFELSAAPHMVSFGRGVFLHEMIELVGAENIFADQDSWISVSDEVVPAADPDVILTSVGYLDDPVGEILSRPGWGGMTAVANGSVFSIDTDSSNRPSHNIVIALQQIAQAVYPEYFG
ncbi:MAG: ABC transporter substrate-binding protein [Oscillospiraceae bacterium]|nr:ABC transporter substrate-binding protein [Oscillospiraceae bacterium]